MCSGMSLGELDAMSVEELKAAAVSAALAVERAVAARALTLAALDARVGGMVPQTPREDALPVLVGTSAWLRAQTLLGPAQSRGQVEQARRWAAVPAVADAVAAGLVRTVQADIVARTLVELGRVEPQLAEAAAPVWVGYAAETEPDPLRHR